MVKYAYIWRTFKKYIIILIIIFINNQCKKNDSKKSENQTLAIVEPEYSVLAEKSLDYLLTFEYEKFGTMLTDSISYSFPDGDINTRTTLVGKQKVLDWWNEYHKKSGLEYMNAENANYFPIEIKSNTHSDLQVGVNVFSYFSNKMIYKGRAVAMRMHFIFHFNNDKMIDQITSYYDRNPIIEVTGKNLLEVKKQIEQN